MKRTDLVECVDLVGPAVASHNIIPILSHIWFTKTGVMAYNDTIAISTQLQTDLECAIQGTAFTDLVKTLHRNEVTLTQENNGNARLKSGGVNVLFPTMPASSFIFEMPKSNGAMHLPEVFLEGIELCLHSAGDDPGKPEQLGVTLVKANDKFLAMFGTNDQTLTYVPVSLKTLFPIKDRITLSTEFCKQAIRLSKGKKGQVEVTSDYALLTLPNVTLLGKLVECDRPVEFHKIVNQNVPTNIKDVAIPIPSRLKEMILRATIISDVPSERGNHTAITIQDGRLKMRTKSQQRGEITDSVLLKNSHPDVELKLDCRHIKSGLDTFDKMLITDKCMILTNAKNAIHMIAAIA